MSGVSVAAFGLSRGIFVAHALQQKVGENANPWPAVDAAFAAPVAVLPKELLRDMKELAPTWKGLSAERKAYLRLLSRFELTSEQAKAFYDDGSRRRAGWGGADREILQDPYRIFELTRHDPEGVRLLTVDRGVFAEDMVRLQHPLEVPSQSESAVDCVERALSQSRLWKRQRPAAIPRYPKTGSVEAVRGYPVGPECPLTGDMLNAMDIPPDVVRVEMAAEFAMQLDRYRAIGDLVRKQVLGRVGGRRHNVTCDWEKLLDKIFGLRRHRAEASCHS